MKVAVRTGLLLVVALVLAQSAPAAGPPESDQRQHQPTLLWKTFPLQQRPTARDEVTIERALRTLDQPAAAGRAQPDARSAGVILFLLLAVILLGAAGLPERALPTGGADFVDRCRLELVVTGVASLAAAVLVLLVG